MRVVICGGGIIGTSIAYNLALRGIKPIVVDKAGIAHAASGKAGGFLALDWNDHSPLGNLARKSFDLHQKLADALDTDIGYRRLTCEAILLDERPDAKLNHKKLSGLEWADTGVRRAHTLGTRDTIAQVHPRLLTEAMWAEASKLGASLRIGSVTDLSASTEKSMADGVVLDTGEVIFADIIVVAMGPWSGKLMDSLGLGCVKVLGQKYHSILVHKDGSPLSQATFCQGLGDPEFYPRPDGDVYVTGFPDEPSEMSEEPDNVEVRDEIVKRLAQTAGAISTLLKGSTVTREQACHLPIADGDGLPLIGPSPLLQNAYVATGHSCWGILNGPATGLCVTELILEGRASSVDISPFDPRRYVSS